MTKVKSFILILCMFILLIISLTPIKAQGYNETVVALNQSRLDLQETIEAGFNVLRINDTHSQAEQLFEAQYALETAGGTPDYSLILERTKEVAELKNQVEEMSDELKALEARINDLGYESEAIAIFSNANKEFDDERYDKVSELVEEAYVIISEEQALQTRFRAIYQAGTETITGFLKDRWKEITFTIVFISLIYLYTHKKIAIYLINRKIKSLNFEKDVLKKLIKQTQYEYFHLFKIPEDLFHIRLEKFGELIRDIDRQIPLQIEDRERIKGLPNEEIKAKKTKILKRIILISLSLLTLIATIIFLIVTFKIASLTNILEFIKKISFIVADVFNLIITTFGFIAIVIVSILILSAIFVYIYIRKKIKREEPKIEIKKRFKFLQPILIFLSNNFTKLKLFSDRLIKGIENSIEYRRLLKQRREQEDLPRIRYLRKQKIISIKNNLKQKFHLPFHSVSLVKTKEKKLEKRKIKDLKEKKSIEVLPPPPPS